MSNDRRRQRRRERQRQRRGQGRGYEPAGAVQFPGVFGWMQRHQRAFFAAGIMVLLASLGAAFIGTQLRGNNSSSNGDATATATPTETATATATATETVEPTPEDPDAIVRSYSEPPAMQIDTSAHYEAVIHTERGDVRLELFPEDAPEYVNNFVFLARNRFYDGLTFHRVQPGFVAQAGDPSATGFGGPGYGLDEEFNDLEFDEGVIAMARGNGVSGSQFFITLAPEPQLKDAGFTVFGRVTEGLDVLQSLTPRDPQGQGQPPGDRILSIEIIEQAS